MTENKNAIALRNESPHEFKRIIGKVRWYLFPCGTFPDGAVVTVIKPRWLHVSKSGGHRIVDAAGVGHYIPPGWIHLWWTVEDDEPHFTI